MKKINEMRGLCNILSLFATCLIIQYDTYTSISTLKSCLGARKTHDFAKYTGILFGTHNL